MTAKNDSRCGFKKFQNKRSVTVIIFGQMVSRHSHSANQRGHSMWAQQPAWPASDPSLKSKSHKSLLHAKSSSQSRRECQKLRDVDEEFEKLDLTSGLFHLPSVSSFIWFLCLVLFLLWSSINYPSRSKHTDRVPAKQ